MSISRDVFRSRLRTAHNLAVSGCSGVVETLVEYEDSPKLLPDAARAAAEKLEKAAMGLRVAAEMAAQSEWVKQS